MDKLTNTALLQELFQVKLLIRMATMPSDNEKPNQWAITAVEDAFKFLCKYGNLIEENAQQALANEKPIHEPVPMSKLN